MNFFKPNFWDKNKISFLSILFFPISLLVRLLIFLNYSLTKNYSFPIPVICVGNIYLGGTGKTPLCIEIFSILKSLNINPVFIRKQYSSFQDELDILKKTGTTYQNKKRAKAIREAIKNKAGVAILDDGFQDLSVNKNWAMNQREPEQLIDTSAQPEDLNDSLCSLLEKLEPFGMGNESPVWGLYKVTMEKTTYMNMDKHLKTFLTNPISGAQIPAIGFGWGEFRPENRLVNAAVILEWNYFRGQRQRQARIIDLQNAN